jgi:hypothetical protein
MLNDHIMIHLIQLIQLHLLNKHIMIHLIQLHMLNKHIIDKPMVHNTFLS